MLQNWPRDSVPLRQSFPSPSIPQHQPGRHCSFLHGRSGYTTRAQNDFHQEWDPINNENGPSPDAHKTNSCQQSFDIEDALIQHCGMPIRYYFLAMTAEDGTSYTFTIGGRSFPESVVRQFFDTDKFQQVMDRLEAGGYPMLDDSVDQEDLILDRNIFGPNGTAKRGRSSELASDGEWAKPRGPLIQDDEAPMIPPSMQSIEVGDRDWAKSRGPLLQDDDDDTPMMAPPMQSIEIGDTDAVWSFYEQQFKNCQQAACKLIAKAWVKAVQPKKQTAYPYTGGDEKAPDWWPKPSGLTKHHRVRHKEPDHLYKQERIYLLAHILRLVVEPKAMQHPAICKLGLDVRKLEEITAESLSSFFQKHSPNADKKPYLREIFRLARQEERYRNGEIHGSTLVFVVPEIRVPGSYTVLDDEAASFVTEDQDVEPMAKPSMTMANTMRPNASVHTNATTLSGAPREATMRPNASVRTAAATLSGAPREATTRPHASVRTDATALSGAPREATIGQVPIHASRFPPPMANDMVPQHSFVENGTTQVHGEAGVTATGFHRSLDLESSQYDASHRPSVFSNYVNPENGNIYPQQWQPGSNGASNLPAYAYAAQHSNVDPYLSRTRCQ